MVIIQRINLGLFALFGDLRARNDWRAIAEELWPFVETASADADGGADRDMGGGGRSPTDERYRHGMNPTQVIETHDPRDGSLLATVPNQSADAVQTEVARARAAFPAWSALGYGDRAAHILKVRDRLLDRAEELVEVICAETGKQPAEAVTTELMAVCETIEWYVRNGEAALRPVPVAPGTLVHKKAWKQYAPMGVVGVISPWNYPFTLSMTPIVTALFAGNTVVMKPSEVTPTVGLAIGELFADDIWGDIVQVVTGGGATGEALVRSGVDKVAFTGSAATGRKVMAAAADSLTPVLLELGGKDPMIVAEDADVDRAVKGAVWGSFQNAGQTCMSVERVYVAEAVYDRFVDGVVRETALIRQDASGEGDIGAMTFEPQVGIVERHVADAVDKGATVLCGGRRRDLPGLWFEPTVLVDVDHTMDIMSEETFGPVMPIMAVPDAEAGLELANDSPYGLNSSVWTRRPDPGGVDRRPTPGRQRVHQRLHRQLCGDRPSVRRGEELRYRTGTRSRGATGVLQRQGGARPEAAAVHA